MDAQMSEKSLVTSCLLRSGCCATIQTMELQIYDIFNYIGNDRRPLVEGERLFKAKHVMMCGILEKEEKKALIVALCLRTSQIDGKPHEVRINMQVETEKKLECTCSCVAGLSGTCKHIVAVLFYMNQETLNNLEDLSCTDLKQQWGKIKGDAKKLIEVVPISDFCHVPKLESPYGPVNTPDDSLLNTIRKKLVAGNSSSEAFIYQKYVDHPTTMHEAAPPQNLLLEKYLNATIDSCKYTSFHSSLDKTLGDFYRQRICLTKDDSIRLCITTEKQCCEVWRKARQLRITGSTAYTIFTYSKNKNADWEKKVKSTLLSPFQGNENTIYGLKSEPLAIDVYKKSFKCDVKRVGLFIQPNIPYLAYSADGIIIENSTLIEVKCPISGKHLTATESVAELKYLKGSLSTNNLTLKKKHKYYGQVQFGMGLLNCSKCHFIIFSSLDKTLVVIEIPFDPLFFESMLKDLGEIYFTCVLPVLFKIC